MEKNEMQENYKKIQREDKIEEGQKKELFYEKVRKIIEEQDQEQLDAFDFDEAVEFSREDKGMVCFKSCREDKNAYSNIWDTFNKDIVVFRLEDGQYAIIEKEETKTEIKEYYGENKDDYYKNEDKYLLFDKNESISCKIVDCEQLRDYDISLVDYKLPTERCSSDAYSRLELCYVYYKEYDLCETPVRLYLDDREGNSWVFERLLTEDTQYSKIYNDVNKDINNMTIEELEELKNGLKIDVDKLESDKQKEIELQERRKQEEEDRRKEELRKEIEELMSKRDELISEIAEIKGEKTINDDFVG